MAGWSYGIPFSILMICHSKRRTSSGSGSSSSASAGSSAVTSASAGAFSSGSASACVEDTKEEKKDAMLELILSGFGESETKNFNSERTYSEYSVGIV